MESKYYVSVLKKYIQITQAEKEDVYLFRKENLTNIEIFPIKEHSTFAVDLSYGHSSMRAEFRTKNEAISFVHRIIDLLEK